MFGGPALPLLVMAFRFSFHRWCLAGVFLATALGCTGEPQRTLRIGDAVPRATAGGSLRDVLQPLLAQGDAPRIAIAPWSIPISAVGVGEDAQARRFIDDSSVIAVVGHSGSRPTLMVEPLYREAGLPLIVPTSTARSLRSVGSHVHMLVPTDDLIGAFLVDEARERLGVRRLGMLYVIDAYGEGIFDGVRARVRERSDSLVGAAALSGMECEGDGAALDAVIKAFLRRHRPDGIIVALPQVAAWCAVRALSREDPALTIITTDSFVLDEASPLSAAERANTHALLFWEPGTDSASTAFVARWRAVLQRDPYPGEALEYDAFQLIVAAIRAGHTSRAAVQRWLQALGTEGHPPFAGLTGPIDFRNPRTGILRLKSLRLPSPTP